MAIDPTKPEDSVQVSELPGYIRESRAAMLQKVIPSLPLNVAVLTAEGDIADSGEQLQSFFLI